VTLLEAARPFVATGNLLPISLPDRAHMGIGELTAEHFRVLVALDSAGEDREGSWIPALRPFAAASKSVPEKARDWDFGTTGLKYGDFMRVAEAMEASATAKERERCASIADGEFNRKMAEAGGVNMEYADACYVIAERIRKEP